MNVPKFPHLRDGFLDKNGDVVSEIIAMVKKSTMTPRPLHLINVTLRFRFQGLSLVAKYYLNKQQPE